MAERKWTPGPWVVKDEGDKWIWVGPVSWVKRVCMVVLYNGTEREDQANANLIAAAPELYEALEASRLYLSYHHSAESLENIDAILAKARGEA